MFQPGRHYSVSRPLRSLLLKPWLGRSTRRSVNNLRGKLTRSGTLTRERRGFQWVIGLWALPNWRPGLCLQPFPLLQLRRPREKDRKEQVEHEFKHKHSDEVAREAVRTSKCPGGDDTTVRSSVRRVRPLRGSCNKKAPVNPLTKQLIEFIFWCRGYNSSDTGFFFPPTQAY